MSHSKELYLSLRLSFVWDSDEDSDDGFFHQGDR